MSDLGLLGILIPDFKRVSGQIQFGGFHTYTVDEHTLKAIGYINDMEVKKILHLQNNNQEIEIHNIKKLQ